MPSSETNTLIGLDLGGTSVKAGIVTRNGDILYQQVFDLPDRLPEDIINIFKLAIDTLLEKTNKKKENVIAIGVCCPGLSDIPNGIVNSCANFPAWTDVDVVTPLKDYVGCPAFLENDGTAAACGEWWHLSNTKCAGIANMCMLTLGTGVGCGVVADGRVIYGKGMAGEYGHAIVDYSPEARVCGCGQSGCLERYVSAEGIMVTVEEQANILRGDVVFSDSEFLKKLEANQTNGEESPSCKDLFQAADNKDIFALHVVEIVTKMLGFACINLSRVFDTEAIIIGGGVSNAGSVLIEGIRKHYLANTWKFKRHEVIIDLASLHNDAGFLGVAKVALDKSNL